MSDRQVAHTSIRGYFPLPLGFSFFRWDKPGTWPRTLGVSTVRLDGGHLEDPLGICEEETGFETMVFLAGYSSGVVYQEHYSTKEEAQAGHARIVEQILAVKLPLTISLGRYCAHEAVEGNHTEHAEHVKPISNDERRYIAGAF